MIVAFAASRIRAISARRPPFAGDVDRFQETPVFFSTATCRTPPKLIEKFVAFWRKVTTWCYGRRVKREAPLLMQFAYKAFYRVFDAFSYVRIPHDAGDFLSY